jgi:hypothetical protein
MTLPVRARPAVSLKETGRLRYEIDPIPGVGAQGLLCGVPREAVDKLISIERRR